MGDPRRKRTVACPCGAAIPYRNVYDFYRLTPHHKKIRAEQGLGKRFSRTQQFMDAAEAAAATLENPAPGAVKSGVVQGEDITPICPQ